MRSLFERCSCYLREFISELASDGLFLPLELVRSGVEVVTCRELSLLKRRDPDSSYKWSILRFARL